MFMSEWKETEPAANHKLKKKVYIVVVQIVDTLSLEHSWQMSFSFELATQ